MKLTKILPAMLLLPTLAEAQNAKVDPSLVRAHMQTIGLSVQSGPAVQTGFSTYWIVGPGVDSEPFASQISAVNGTFKNLYMNQGAQGTQAISVYTWRINGTDTAITCTITPPATTCSDLVHTAPIVAGQSYDLKTFGAGSSNVSVPVFGGIELDTP